MSRPFLYVVPLFFVMLGMVFWFALMALLFVPLTLLVGVGAIDWMLNRADDVFDWFDKRLG